MTRPATPQARIPSGIGAIAAIGFSLGCAVLLHGAPDRSGAVAALLPVVVWGPLALWSAGRLPAAGPLAVAALALAVRLPLVGTPPHLSDDVYRYLWEGLVLNAGHNPFVDTAASLGALEPTLAGRVNHPAIPSIYPPVALAWFRALSALGGAVPVAQLATSLADAAVAGTLAAVLSGRGRAPWPAWLYALHPLPALEAAAGAHLDVVAVLAALAAVRLHDTGRIASATVAAWVGIGVKLLPVVLLPALVRSAPRRAALGTAAALALLIVAALPVLGAGPALLDAMGTYGAHWSFNGLLFPWLEPVLGTLARPLLIAIGAAVCAVAAWRHTDPARLWAVAGATFVLLSPTVHPWYALWALVPSLILGRRGWAVAGLFLLGSYTVLWAYDPVSGGWSEAPWLWWITWPPALVALAADALAARTQERSEPSPTAP